MYRKLLAIIHLDRSQYHHNSNPGMDEAEFILGLWILFLVQDWLLAVELRSWVLFVTTMMYGSSLGLNEYLESVLLLPHFLVP